MRTFKEWFKERTMKSYEDMHNDGTETALQLVKDAWNARQEEIDELKKHIGDIQKCFAPTSGEWQFVESMLEQIRS